MHEHLSVDIHSNQARHAANGESTQRSKLFSRRNIALGELLQRCVASKSRGRVSSLSCRRWHKALEESANSSLLGDYFTAV